jgi:2-dehydropantoate 2-reductase
MRIGVMAAGAVGGYVGARLAAAGHDVVFFARGAHLDAMRRDGLRVKSGAGDLHLKPANVTNDPSGVAPVDIVIFAVKLWDTEKAGAQIKPIVTRDTRVITFQNGVDSVERLAPILGAESVVGGTAVIGTVISEPGTILHSGSLAQFRCGRIDGKPDAKLAAFVDVAKAAGLDMTLSQTMRRDIWQKFVILVGLSGATAMTRMPLGAVMADKDTRAMFRALLEETNAVGRAAGVDLALDFADDRFKFAEKMHYDMKASMLHDLERGNKLELDWLAGRVVALGREHNIATPMNVGVYAALKLHSEGASPR